MKSQINNLIGKIRLQMQQELAEEKNIRAANLAPYLIRAEMLHTRLRDLESELSSIQIELSLFDESSRELAGLSRKNENFPITAKKLGRAENKTLHIEIDWKANGKPMDKEVIAMPMAADAMAQFLARLIEELGPDSIDKLGQIRINRGPLVSRQPSKDFLNRKTGKPYNHKEIGHTGYFVLTNNQTHEKLEALLFVCEKLKLADGSVKIKEMGKKELLMERYLRI